MSIDAFPPTGTSTDDTLDALAGLSTSANTMPYFTGVDLAALTPLTPFIRTLLDDPDLATAQATLGITAGGGYTDEQAQDAIGVMLLDTATIDLVYTDATPSLSASVIAGSIGTPQLANDSVTYAKIQNVTDARLLGRSAGSAGDAQELTVGSGLSLSGGALTATGGYTDEQAQDAVGAMLINTSTVTLTYGDGGPTLQADVNNTSITEAKLAFVDVTTRDASISAHGLLRKLSGTATQYLDGSGAWTTPAGGTQYWSRGGTSSPSYYTGLLAWWRMEEASGNRLDSMSGMALVPQGTVANITNAAGKTGNALRLLSTAGTYLSMADNATMSVGVNQSFTVALWVYWDGTPTSENGFVAKGGNTAATTEYQWLSTGGNFHFVVGNGSLSMTKTFTGLTVATGTWYFLVGWWDSAAGQINVQINNATVQTSTYAGGSYDSGQVLEVGRQFGYTPIASYPNGRIDNLMFWKRTLTTQERTDLWNGGTGVDYGATLPYLTPVTTTDRLALTTVSTTQERLEVDGAIKLGTTAGTTDGTLRWSGTDFEGRKAGAWVSMTSGGGGQPLDATLTALAGLATGADQLPYSTGTDTFSQTPFTSFARTLLDDTTQAAMRTTLGLTPGTDVQAQDAELQAIAGLTSAADRLPYFTGLGTAALATFTAAGRTLAGAADAAAQRTALALGTMAQQDAHAVAITGGSATGLTQLSTNGHLTVSAQVGIRTGPVPGITMALIHSKSGGAVEHGMVIGATGANTGTYTMMFNNMSGTAVGAIDAGATGTVYGTTSDVRLKHAIAPLSGALDVVRALRPITHLWNADDSRGYGFLAHELQREIPDAVTGQPDEVNPDGSVKPQQVDHSRLVVWLVAAVQELASRVVSLEEQLGI